MIRKLHQIQRRAIKAPLTDTHHILISHFIQKEGSPSKLSLFLLTFPTPTALINPASHMTFDLQYPAPSHCVLSKFGVLSRADTGCAGYSFESGGERITEWRFDLECVLLIVHMRQ